MLDQEDLDSTLIRRGVSAATLSDMAEFVDTIQERPLDKLMAELPALAELSTTKFSLARQTFRRRVRTLERVDYEQLRVIAFEVADDAGSEVGERIRSLFALA
ncbi:MAG TPA: hypothetical protein VGQ36_09495 [Thermoanaerobaculia bacterium]|jgi:hypothetical protein|nr:hypothetical protein [Thermoanaerobaculia bacterium]